MKKTINILIVDDDDFITDSLTDFLLGRGFSIQTASSGKEGIERFRQNHPAVVLLDQKLPDISGIETCRQILSINPNTKIIFITAFPTVQYAVEAMQSGAFNYVSKPFELDELLIAINMAIKNVHLEGRLRVQDYKKEKERREKKLIGSSDVMQRIRQQIELAADTDANVLITGETGVGKNEVAEAIHNLQNERDTFLTINCAAIPEHLIEAEYFGHEKGVFTGADSQREGIFELADGGTLLLDEISEIPIHLQSKLLTVLESKRIRRIGSGRTIPVDVRIIACSNENLENSIKNRKFRQDLYYRLAVFNLRIPPLREHAGDIPEIADYFAKRLCRGSIRIPDSQILKLLDYPWPGNVRELRNIIERASLLLQGDRILPADLLNQAGATHGFQEEDNIATIDEITPLDEVINQHIGAALKACNGNKSMASRHLGISLSTLKRKLKEVQPQSDRRTLQFVRHSTQNEPPHSI